MKFQELYEKGIDRKVNPAVSASDLSDETVLTEIDEYVFTEEIIINLYKILSNIKFNQGSHVGIWINGYYGSGKSHFLKYTSYCLSQDKDRCKRAFVRLIEATEEILHKSTGISKLEQEGVSVSELKALQNWYVTQAEVEMVMFNIGDVHDVNAKHDTAFTTIFWNQFNAKRGYNSFNLAFAQFLEKALDDDGKLQEFKDYVAQNGYDWQTSVTRFAAGRLDLALKMAKEVDPNLSTDVIRNCIVNNAVNVSVDAFANEMKEFIDKKHNRNFRLLFFVDEVSQFIGAHRDLLLQLQSLVKRLEEVCSSQCWIACTAQQTLEDVVLGVGGNSTNPEDEVGKILGRFEVRASLQGTSPEYITQKRILDKKPSAEIMLSKMFQESQAKLDAQFVLPSQYRGFGNADDFVAFYPFVPYQFQLIMRVLDSFVNLNFVDKQVKGNERSLINITFSIVKETANLEVGEFIPFDRFFGAMFQGSMQHLGQMAMANAREALQLLVNDPKKYEFYQRVVYVLFMICHLSDTDKPTFAASIDNIVTLLMTKVDASKAAIKQEVSSVLAFLVDKAVIRKIKTEEGNEIYDFYTQEESQVAQLIKNQTVDAVAFTDEMKNIIFSIFGSPSNKKTFGTRSFNVGINIDSRNYLSNNADVVVDFVVNNGDIDSVDQYAFSISNQTEGQHLVYYLSPLFRANKELNANFNFYCRVQRFAQEPATSENRQKTVNIFKQRAKELYDKEIKPQFQQMLDTCPVISCGAVLSAVEIGKGKGKERYENMLDVHMNKLYHNAKMVESPETPKNAADLVAMILRPVEEGIMDSTLSRPEQKIAEFLGNSLHDLTVADVVHKFSKVPFGWSDFATIYFLNELVRRHLYAFNYNNDPNVSREVVAHNVVREAAKFTVEKARAISQQLINDFIQAWKDIFATMSIKGSNDSTELFRNCKENDDSELKKLLHEYRRLYRNVAQYPFANVVNQVITLLENWIAERDPQTFFQTIIDAKATAHSLIDKCKSIEQFNRNQLDKYEEIRNFITQNEDNFAFLPDDVKKELPTLRAILEDQEPWEHFPPYWKLKRAVSNCIDESRAQLVNEIKAKYNEVIDSLEKYAAEHNVSRNVFADRNTVLAQKTSSNNLYALKFNLDASDFNNAQLRKINEAIEEAKAKEIIDKDPKGDNPKVEPIRLRKVISLKTETVHPMRSEADVDQYLANLKAEIMKHISDNTDLIVS